MKYIFTGKKIGDALSGHKYDDFTKDKVYDITWGKANKYNPLYEDIYRAYERTLVIDDKGTWVDISNNAMRKYFIKYE